MKKGKSTKRWYQNSISWLTMVIGVIGLLFTWVQIDLAKEQNYFNTINTVSTSKNKIELLLFAFAKDKSNKERYINMISYYISKDIHSVNDKFTLILSKEQNNLIFEAIIKTMNELTSSLENQKASHLKYDVILLQEKYNALNNLLNWVNKNIHYLLINKTDEKTIISITNIVYKLFKFYSNNNTSNMSTWNYSLPSLNIYKKSFPYLSIGINTYANILGQLMIYDRFPIPSNNIEDKVLNNLALYYKMYQSTIIQDQKKLSNVFTKNFTFLSKKDFKSNKKLNTIYLLSLLRISNYRFMDRFDSNAKNSLLKHIDNFNEQYDENSTTHDILNLIDHMEVFTTMYADTLYTMAKPCGKNPDNSNFYPTTEEHQIIRDFLFSYGTSFTDDFIQEVQNCQFCNNVNIYDCNPTHKYYYKK